MGGKALEELKSKEEMALEELEEENEEDDSEDSEDSEDCEDSGNEAWPNDEDRYSKTGDPFSVINTRSRLAREFTMGAGFYHEHEEYAGAKNKMLAAHKLDSIRVASPSYISKILLITDAPEALLLHGDTDGPGGLCLMGIEFLRDGVVFSTGGLTQEEPCKLNLKESVINRVEMQQCTWLEEMNAGTGRVEKKISYLKMVAGQESIVFGQMAEAGFDGDKCIFSRIHTTDGKLLVTGVGYYDNKPITLQLVDLGKDGDVNDIDTTVYYGHGVISARCVRAGIQDVEHKGAVAMGDEDLWDVVTGCMDAVENLKPSHGELLPNVVNLFEHALAGDLDAMHSVFRMDRYLTYVIQDKLTVQVFENDHLNFYSKLIPMKQMWAIFADAIERLKRLESNQPQSNCFTVAFFLPTPANICKSVFVFLTQVILLVLTYLHVSQEVKEKSGSINMVQIAVACVATMFVMLQVSEHANNYRSFVSIFPEYKGTLMCTLDACSNVVFGVIVIVLNFLLLFYTNGFMDLVLNATAMAFVLELDENVVNAKPSSMYRSFLMKNISSNLGKTNWQYWDPEWLRKARGNRVKIHNPTCSFVFDKEHKD